MESACGKIVIKSAEEFVKLRTSEIKEEYDRAVYEEAPLDVWMAIVQDYPDMRKWVAHNKAVPVEVLDVLSKDADARVRDVVARKRKSTLPILERLATDPDATVRHSVAWNKSTPSTLLQRLLSDPWSPVVEVARTRLAQTSSD